MDLEGQAREMLNAYGGFHTGTLHVGAVGPYHATEMLSAFSERYPGIRLSVTVGNSREMVERLLDYSADVAVLAHVEDDPRIFAMPYSRHKVAVFVNDRHRLARRRRIRIEELEGERMVLREHGSTTRLAFEAALRRHDVTIDPVMEIGSREAVWLAVARGIGIGVVSDIEFVPRPDLRILEVVDAEIYTTAPRQLPDGTASLAADWRVLRGRLANEAAMAVGLRRTVPLGFCAPCLWFPRVAH